MTPSSTTAAVSTHEILEQLDLAIAEHMRWLKAWHRSLLCAEAPFPEDLAYDPQDLGRFGTWYVKNQHRGLVDQPAVRNLAGLYREMHDQARGLARDARAGLPLVRESYDAFMDTSAAFISQARRLERAFATASSDLDPLTGVHNRQAMERDLERERTRALRSNRPCCFALADLDRFKAINDAHGHGAGDRVLVAAAERFLAALRPYDSVYRYGGEEFLFCLPDTSATDAQGILERVRRKLEERPVPTDRGDALAITASFGFAEVDADCTMDETIQRADRALYRAKALGRNRVCSWLFDADLAVDG